MILYFRLFKENEVFTLTLLESYKEFTKINSEYINYINELVNTDLGKCDNKEVINCLIGCKNRYEFLKIKVDDYNYEEENIDTLKQLKMYIMDGLLLSIDLLRFYESKQVERFKMRAVNYINKERMKKFIEDNPFENNISFGNCRVNK